MLVKNTKGERSWSLTIALTAFFVSTIILIAGSIWPDLFKIPETGVIIGYLTSCLGIYGFRRHTDRDTKH